jgi:Sec-independent protein translocase protein TatA
LNAAASFGQSLLGAVFSRKRGGSSASRVGSSIGRIQKETSDVARAQLAELEAEDAFKEKAAAPASEEASP